MSALSHDELKTILHFGVHVAKIDGDFNVWERKLLIRLAEAVQLNEEEKAQLMNAKFSLGQGLRALQSKEAQTMLVKTLCAVSQVDGEVSDVELEFVERVVVQLPTQVFLLGRDEWAQYVDEVNGFLDTL